MSYKEAAEWGEVIKARDWRAITRMVREHIETPEVKQGMSLREWLETMDDPDTALGEVHPSQIARVWDRLRDSTSN